MWQVALKNLHKRKKRTFLALVGLALGIGAVVSLVAIADGIKAFMGDTLGKMQAISVLEEGAMDDTLSSLPYSYVEEMEDLQFVRVAVPMVTGSAKEVDGKILGISSSFDDLVAFWGLDPERVMKLPGGLKNIFGYEMVSGRFLTSSDTYSVVLGKKVADNFKKSVGSTIEIDGIKFRVVGIVSSGSDWMDMVALMPIRPSQELAGKDKDTINMLYVSPTDLTKMSYYSELLELRFDDITAMGAQEFSEEMGGLLTTIDMFFWLISMVAAVIGAVGIMNTMLMSVIERKDEFGLLRAVGWTKSDVVGLVLKESILLGIVGGALGLGLGFLVTYVAITEAGLLMHVGLELVAIAFGFAVSFGAVGGVYPAYKATLVTPMQAMRYG